MRNLSNERGFTLTELTISTAITLVLLATAMTTAKNAMTISESGTQLADSNQNLRAGANLLVRDLMQAGRDVPAGGIPIPTGTTTATDLKRPMPPSSTAFFLNDDANSTLPAIVSGYMLGPTVDNKKTDIVTMMMSDPVADKAKVIDVGGTLTPADSMAGTIATNGDSVTLPGTHPWMAGDATNGISKIQVGDLVLFENAIGAALQAVTDVTTTDIKFSSGDWFNFNQGTNPQGIKALKGAGTTYGQTSLRRMLMVTYYVDASTTPGTPRLTRMINHYAPQALAGVVEDMEITYDLVDGNTNPPGVTSLPYTANGNTYTANLIRKVNLHIGVRSENMSTLRSDYIRNHVNTSVSVRAMTLFARYR